MCREQSSFLTWHGWHGNVPAHFTRAGAWLQSCDNDLCWIAPSMCWAAAWWLLVSPGCGALLLRMHPASQPCCWPMLQLLAPRCRITQATHASCKLTCCSRLLLPPKQLGQLLQALGPQRRWAAHVKKPITSATSE